MGLPEMPQVSFSGCQTDIEGSFVVVRKNMPFVCQTTLPLRHPGLPL